MRVVRNAAPLSVCAHLIPTSYSFSMFLSPTFPIAINLFLAFLKFPVPIGPVSPWPFLLGPLSSLLAVVAFPGRAVACSHL